MEPHSLEEFNKISRLKNVFLSNSTYSDITLLLNSKKTVNLKTLGALQMK